MNKSIIIMAVNFIIDITWQITF